MLLVLGIFCSILTSCVEEIDTRPFYEERYSISEYVRLNDDRFHYFQQLLKVGRLERTLTAYNPNGNDYTLFLPTDEAIDKFIDDNGKYPSFDELLADSAYVSYLVRYHVVNAAIGKNDFPFGSFSDTTISGDILTMGFIGNIDSLVYVLNNHASVTQSNIVTTNGLIHVIDEVIVPAVNNSYEWLKLHPDYSIFRLALEITGLKDTFSYEGKPMLSTLLVESDLAFHKSQIFSIDDLISQISPDREDYTALSNDLYQYVAYHILNGKYYLNDFEGTNTNYNTYASSTVAVNGIGLDIKINQGIGLFYTGKDTIDYIRIDYDNSNVSTSSGAIHIIENVMEYYIPGQIQRTFQFLEEPIIIEASKNPNEYIFTRTEDFDVLHWEGIEQIKYVASASANGANRNDYIEFDGDFTVSYKIPEILPGVYTLQIAVKTGVSGNATIRVYVDDDQIGINIDLTTGTGFQLINVGLVNFVRYEKHVVRIENLVPGVFTWDYIRFQPK